MQELIDALIAHVLSVDPSMEVGERLHVPGRHSHYAMTEHQVEAMAAAARSTAAPADAGYRLQATGQNAGTRSSRPCSL